MIIGLGTDIVELTRLDKALRRQSFAEHVYTVAELAAAETHGSARSTFLSGRWAAKEALSKALGCGIGAKCSFLDIEILNNSAGAPVATLCGTALETMRELGAKRILLSISHEQSYAVSTVILEG